MIEKDGVSDGIRTRDVQIHSLALYQAELRSPQVVMGPPLYVCNIQRQKVSIRANTSRSALTAHSGVGQHRVGYSPQP